MKTKILFPVLGLAVLGEIVWAIFYLTNPLKFFQKPPPAPRPPTKEAQVGARLLLQPEIGEFKLNSSFWVDIVLDTGGNQVAGTDAVLRYDPTRLEVVDARTELSGIQISPGSVFSEYPANIAEPQTGRISLSGLSPINTPFVGRGVMGRVLFKGKALGKTQVFFEYQPAVTSDSNVASTTSKDILDKATGGTYIIISN